MLQFTYVWGSSLKSHKVYMQWTMSFCVYFIWGFFAPVRKKSTLTQKVWVFRGSSHSGVPWTQPDLSQMGPAGESAVGLYTVGLTVYKYPIYSRPITDVLTSFTGISNTFSLLCNSYVTINPTLCDCLLEKSEFQEVDSLKWDDLFSR